MTKDAQPVAPPAPADGAMLVAAAADEAEDLIAHLRNRSAALNVEVRRERAARIVAETRVIELEIDLQKALNPAKEATT